MTGRRPTDEASLWPVTLSAFLATTGVLAGAGAMAGFAVAVVRGGGAAAPRWLILIAVAGLGGALIAAPFAAPGSPGTRRAITIGIASAGAVTATAVAIRWLPDTGGIGPFEIGVFTAGVAVAVSAPWLAKTLVETRAVDRLTAAARKIERDLDRSDGADSASSPPRLRSAELALVGLGVVALIAALAYVLPVGPLGHDEAVYALKARSWLEGTPATGFGVYRPVGMPVVGWVVLHISDSEVAFRAVATVLAVATAVTMWAIGRTMLSPAAALLGTGAFVVSESFLRRATEFLNDLTSAGMLLVAMFFVWFHFERYPNRWWLLAVAPAASAAYYLRYGTTLGLVVIFVVAGAIWFRRLAESRRQLMATAALLVVLLIPHFWYSQRLTGSFLGVFRAARTAVGGGGGGLADYAEWFPEHLAGTFGAIMMVGGVMFTTMLVILAWRDSRHAPAARTASFLTVTAVVTTFLIGVFTHGEPRFVFLPLMALLLVGGQAVAVLLGATAEIPHRAAAAALIAVVGYALATGAGSMHNRLDSITGSRDVLAETGSVIFLDAGGESCTVESAYIPQLTWYSVCATFGFGYDGPDGEAAYLVLFEDSDRQPSESQLDEMLAETTGVPVKVVPDDDDVYGDGYVYEFVATPTP